MPLIVAGRGSGRTFGEHPNGRELQFGRADCLKNIALLSLPTLEIRKQRSSLDDSNERGEEFALQLLQALQLNGLISTIEHTEDYS
jgi:hypothetical protein